MATNPTPIVLPRPGTTPQTPITSIPAPTEESFTSTFGALLPKVSYLTTSHGKAAYYSLPPSQPANTRPPPRILLLHGIQTPSLGLLPLANALRSSHPQAHFVLLDWWGHGLTSTPIAPHEPALFHALVDALLDHLAWPSAHIVAFSFGAATAVDYVVARRRRVESLALVAPAGLLRSEALGEVQRGYLKGAEGLDERAVTAWVVEFLEGGELVVPGDWRERVGRGEVVAEAVREWQVRMHEGHMASVVAMFRDGGVWDGRERFAAAARAGVETLFVLGEDDDLSSEGELRELGFANVAVVPGAGHGVVRQKVPEVAGLIGDFWRKNGVVEQGS